MLATCFYVVIRNRKGVDGVSTYVYTAPMTTTIQKWGNSCAVRLPQELLRKLDLQAGREVTVREEKNGALSITPAPRHALSLDQMVVRITKKNQHPLVDWGKPVGKEVW